MKHGPLVPTQRLGSALIYLGLFGSDRPAEVVFKYSDRLIDEVLGSFVVRRVLYTSVFFGFHLDVD